jgi:hypothetical protein
LMKQFQKLMAQAANELETERARSAQERARSASAIEILERMRSASSCDFAEMPYWSDHVIKILNGEISVEAISSPVESGLDKFIDQVRSNIGFWVMDPDPENGGCKYMKAIQAALSEYSHTESKK